MTDLDLDAIKARADGYDIMTDADEIFDEPKFYRAYAARAHTLARDVPDLLAEVERLRLSQAAANVQLKERHDDYSKTLKGATAELAKAKEQAAYWKGRWEFQCDQRDQDLLTLLTLEKQKATLEAERDQVLALHTEFDGRCTHCLDWCYCAVDAVRGDCPHGNADWPCKTVAIYATPDPDATTVGGSSPRSNETRYRVGRSVGRTLYENGELFGLVDTAEQAQRIVAALNSQPTPINPQTGEQASGGLIVHQSWDADEIGWGEDAHGIWLDLEAAKAATLRGYIDWYMDYEFSGDDEEAEKWRADLTAELHWKQAHSSWELHGEPVTAGRPHTSWRGVLITSEKVHPDAVDALGPATGTEET